MSGESGDKEKPGSEGRAFGDADPYAVDAAVFDPEQDEFGRRQFCERVGHTIAARQNAGSLVVGIYGEWGEGKSTALNFIERELARHPHVVLVKFNPWRFSDEAHLLNSFFGSLAAALGGSINSPKEKIGGLMRDYGATILGGSKFNPSFLGASLGEVDLGETTKLLGDKLASVSLDEQKKRIGNILSDEIKRVVVLMDDIDRLEREEVQAVFRLVKLTADFAYTTYVLAFDDARVAESIGTRYGKGDAQAGRDFLEKIIQVPLRLPKADVLSLRDFCSKGIDNALALARIDLDEEQQQSFGWAFIQGVEPRLKTPRQCRRYANALAFALPLLRGEARPEDVMLVEALRVFYPQMYEAVRNHPDVFLGVSERFEISITNADKEHIKQRKTSIVNAALEGLNESEKEAARSLLEHLFPRSQAAWRQHYGVVGSEELWEREQRVAAPYYFSRYFSYAIPVGDVPDRDVRSLFEVVDNQPIENITAELRRLVAGERGEAGDRDKRAQRLLSKITRRAKELDEDRSRKLALAVVRIGDELRQARREALFLTTFAQASGLLRDLIGNIAETNRMTLVEQLIDESDSLSTALECFRVATIGKEGGEQIALLDSEAVMALGTYMVTKIRESAIEPTPLYVRFPRDGSYVFRVWARWGSRDETDAYIREKLDAAPESVAELLKRFSHILLGVNEEKSHFLERSNYDSISEIVDPEVVDSALANAYDENLSSADHLPARMLPAGERLARQFASIHRDVRAKKNGSSDALSMLASDSE